MACFLPSGISPGQIFRHDRYYRTLEGEWKAKFLLVLAGSPCGDVIYRLLTSRPHGRPQQPPCYLEFPYPVFFLGYLGGSLTSDSWLSLQQCDDYDGSFFLEDLRNKKTRRIGTLPLDLLCSVLDCAAGADDTTRQQERCIRDVRADLGCP